MSDALWNDLTAIFRDVLENNTLVLEEKTTAKDVEGWDSLNHVVLMVAVEKKFRVKFTAGEIQQLQNVGDLAALIRRKQS